MNCETRSV